MPEVLFVSKPIAPPYHDGTKCLVRDVSTHLQQLRGAVLSTPGAPALLAPSGAVRMVSVYAGAGSFTPALAQNLRAAAWILLRSRADLYHFVFAPNRRTSRVGRWLCARKRRAVVQTIASAPRSFTDVDELLFGDAVVAQSRFSAEQVCREYRRKGLAEPDLRVIPPPLPPGLTRSWGQQAAARASLGIAPDAPLFVYPGDLEVSSGAEVSLRLAQGLSERLPGAVTVIAYRRKTQHTEQYVERLRAQAHAAVRFVESADVLSLVAAANAVIFPVDDLFGKVDLPIVLLEAMALGVPVVTYDWGPLAELEGAFQVASLATADWLDVLASVPATADGRRAATARTRPTLERCSAAAVAEAYERLYLELLDRR